MELDDHLQLIERNDEEKERLANELRHLIGTIPRLQIFIDEVQRAARGDIKLRAVVNGWCRAGQKNTVLGFSGTPYHDAPRSVEVGPVAIRSATIANTVYYYPLATAIADFLKKPRLEVASGLQSIEIVRTGVQRFMRGYGAKTYANGACAKLAIYCGTIARLEEEIYPMLVGELGIPPDRILRYHQGNKTHRVPPDAAADFALLDDPVSRRQIVLLVQIGKEGWDCRSLTGVILSQEGDCPRNMVLQTSCRCLRQVDGGPGETALILLNRANADILDRQLGEEQNTSIAALNAIRAAEDKPQVQRHSRMAHLKLPSVAFYQLRIKYDTQQLETAPDTPARLAAFDPDIPACKAQATITTRYLDERHAAASGALSVNRDTASVYEQYGDLASFPSWLNDIVHEGLGAPRAADLRPYREVLHALFTRVTYINQGLRRYNTLYDQCLVRSAVRLAFHVHRQLLTSEEVVRENADLLLVDKLHAIPDHPGLWPDQDKCREILRIDADPAAARTDPARIEQKKAELRKTADDLGNPELADSWIRELLAFEARRAEAAAARNRTLHYLPYDFSQSDFERKFLVDALTLAELKTAGLELYYNGERALTAFKIDCYARTGRAWRRVGFYTPDFLLIRRDAARDIRQILILETKGKGYANESGFVARRQFMDNEFIRLNNEKFGYKRFDYLPLFEEDGLARNREQLAARIRAFFPRE